MMIGPVVRGMDGERLVLVGGADEAGKNEGAKGDGRNQDGLGFALHDVSLPYLL